MKHLVLSLLTGALVFVGCGDDKKNDRPQRSYLITKDNAVRVTRLGMRVSALAGRHAVIPPGSDPTAVLECPLTGETGKIQIVPTCTPTPGAPEVNCVFTETYTCPAVSGTIENSVEMRADGLDYVLEMADYQEGTAELGFIKYNGTVSAETTPDGKTSYQEDLSVVARGVGDTADTVLTSTSDITVTTSATSLVMDGQVDLNITGMGLGRLNLAKVDFADCKQSPASGTIDLALVNLERAQIVIDGCGDVTLFHFEGDTKVDPEVFTAEELDSAFGQSVTDIAVFRGVTANTEKAAPALLPTSRWCVPLSSTTPVLASAVTTVASLAAIANPAIECLEFAPATTVPSTLPDRVTHTIVEDETGLGLFADPTKNKVHFLRVAAVSSNVPAAGDFTFTWFLQYSGGNLPEYEVNIAPATEITPYCNPAANCPTSKSFLAGLGSRIDHFGVLLVAGAAEAYYFIHMIE